MNEAIKAAIAVKKAIMAAEKAMKIDLKIKKGGMKVSYYKKDTRPSENMFQKPIYIRTATLAPNYEVR